jgi:hypothetical protein
VDNISEHLAGVGQAIPSRTSRGGVADQPSFDFVADRSGAEAATKAPPLNLWTTRLPVDNCRIRSGPLPECRWQYDDAPTANGGVVCDDGERGE